MTVPDRSDLSRREYVRLAVAAGGLAALGACLEADGEDDVPSGTDPTTLPDRQHAWNEYLETDDDGNVRPPEHHVLLALSLTPDVEADGEPGPDEDAAETVEAALRTLERAYEWSNEGLLFTLGYTPTYFERFDGSLPDAVDLPAPEPLTDRESPDTLEFDEFDAVLHLASDRAAVVLAAEEALFGELDDVNGEPVETDLSGVFARHDDRRRTGFVGPGLPAEKIDVSGVPESVPEDAPFFMGFRSGFRESQATEGRVTIESGPFAGGTTQHVSSMAIQLDQWFDQESHAQRVMKTFSPHHNDADLISGVGDSLGSSSALTDDWIDATDEDARNRGVVGHAQKAARAREDGDPLLLRRDFNTVDGDRPGLHFLSLQREIADFVRVREAMTGADLPIGQPQNHGILGYIFVDRRGNYLVPPRSRRALPHPDPE
ncbi:Tat pathway signal protein [Halobacteria archaeon AArc-dxtr1]|nr:Tat pathway signal protein [Halobacteria archaeon AArc-dxtr1]